MSKPSITIAEWDISQANLVSTLSGHRNNGFANAEVPSSNELNGLFNGWSQWFSWLDGVWDNPGTFGLLLDPDMDITLSGTGKIRRGNRVRKLQVSGGHYSAGTVNNTWTPAGNGNIGYIPLVLEEHERLSQVVARVSCGATDVLRLGVWRLDPVAQSTTQLGSSVSSTGHANATEALTVSGLTETVSASDHYVYYAAVDCTAFGAGTATLWGVELTTDVPA